MTKPIHQHFEDFQRGRISRREFFMRSAAAGAGTAVIANYLDAKGAAASPAPRISLTRMFGQEAAKLVPPAADVNTSEPLIFRGWNYRTEIVQDNVARFNQQYSENVDYQTITGDYIAIMENFHIANQPLDMAYANPATLFRWSIPGWVHDYERWWDVDAARGEMYENVRESLTVDGRLFGLPYFVSARGTIATNNVLLEKAGIPPEQWPKTWDELYAMCRQLKADGVAETPLLPHWFAAGVWFGVSWGYLLECLNRGAVLFDENNQPVFDDASLAILAEWRKLLEDGIVPEAVFTMGEADYIDAFSKGTYVFSPQQIYDLKVFNDPNVSQIAGQVYALPVVEQPWGIIDEGIYTVPARDDSDEELARKYRLAGFFGHRDEIEGGDLFVAKRWAIEAALNSGYPAVLEDPEVIEAYQAWLPEPGMLDTLTGILNAAQFPRVWQTFWWEEWNAAAMTQLPQAILGQTPVEEVHANLKQLATDLAEQYSM